MLLEILLQLQLPRGEAELDHRLYCLRFGTRPSAFVWFSFVFLSFRIVFSSLSGSLSCQLQPHVSVGG